MGPIGGVLLHGLITGPAGELFSPISRAAGYVGNAQMPNLIPDVGSVLELYCMGLIKPNLLKQQLLFHGADFAEVNVKRPFGVMWRAALEANQFFPDIGLLLRAQRTGQIIPEEYKVWLHRHKVATSPVRDFLEKMNYEPLAPQELLILWNRDKITEETVDLHLKDRGIADADLLKAFKSLRYEVPPTTDLLRFAQVNATVPAVVNRFQLDAEFDRFWQGQLKDGLTSQGMSEDWARLYWRAHWIRASMAQAQEALQRLRAGRVAADSVFTREDFENVARENDVLPYWRERMRLLAYSPPGLRFVRSLFQTSVINQAEVNEMYQDLGYSPDNAPKLAQTEYYLKQRALATQGHGYTIAQAIALYKENVMQEAGVIAAYTDLGYDAQTARNGINLADDQLQAEKIKHLIALLRLQFLHGETDSATAIAKLTALQMPINRVQLLVGTWEAERELHAPHATLATLAKWVQTGLLSLADYGKRLTNLGFPGEDVARLVAAQAKSLDQHRAKELLGVQKAHKKEAMHAYQLGKGLSDADLIEHIAQDESDLLVELVKAKDKKEVAEMKADVKIDEGKAKAAVKRAAARAKKAVDDMPPE
jgi:hypothetical protein